MAIRDEIDIWARTRWPAGCRIGSKAWIDGLTRRVLFAASATPPAADPLAALNGRTDLEVSYAFGDEDDGGWAVHRVNGGRNDREWTLLVVKPTIAEAITAALAMPR